jgi:hypothetical protein
VYLIDAFDWLGGNDINVIKLQKSPLFGDDGVHPND